MLSALPPSYSPADCGGALTETDFKQRLLAAQAPSGCSASPGQVQGPSPSSEPGQSANCSPEVADKMLSSSSVDILDTASFLLPELLRH